MANEKKCAADNIAPHDYPKHHLQHEYQKIDKTRQKLIYDGFLRTILPDDFNKP